MTYALQGAVEEWRDTARRISTDAERVTAQSEVFSLESGFRSENVHRLKRLLETYAIADPAVGYCQGMSDLAAPVIEMYVKNEANQDCACLLTDQQHPEPRIGQRAQARVCPEIESNVSL
jgi:hypothetical protein